MFTLSPIGGEGQGQGAAHFQSEINIGIQNKRN
jgi:hypothetical protein